MGGGKLLFYPPNTSNVFLAASRWRKDFTFRITDLKFSRVAALGRQCGWGFTLAMKPWIVLDWKLMYGIPLTLKWTKVLVLCMMSWLKRDLAWDGVRFWIICNEQCNLPWLNHTYIYIYTHIYILLLSIYLFIYWFIYLFVYYIYYILLHYRVVAGSS